MVKIELLFLRSTSYSFTEKVQMLRDFSYTLNYK